MQFLNMDDAGNESHKLTSLPEDHNLLMPERVSSMFAFHALTQCLNVFPYAGIILDGEGCTGIGAPFEFFCTFLFHI